MTAISLTELDTVTSDGRAISGPRMGCDTPKCQGAAKLWLTTEGEWRCRTCILRRGCLIATPSQPKGAL